VLGIRKGQIQRFAVRIEPYVSFLITAVLELSWKVSPVVDRCMVNTAAGVCLPSASCYRGWFMEWIVTFNRIWDDAAQSGFELYRL
jgi:hypothetical protein